VVTKTRDAKGYYKKFTVTDNRTGEEVDEETFTIKMHSDPHARAALLAYADSVEVENAELARDLRARFMQA
jgi:hypothetical protein